ncbi:MAG: hypothetical protein HYU75_09615 [Betaproteobacteria bacterium]|nr:hypothetical protein [Betaproteobacteria bacterium]
MKRVVGILRTQHHSIFELHEEGGASDLDKQFVIHSQTVPGVHPLPVIIELSEQYQSGRLDFRKIFPPPEAHAAGSAQSAARSRELAPVRRPAADPVPDIA